MDIIRYMDRQEASENYCINCLYHISKQPEDLCGHPGFGMKSPVTGKQFEIPCIMLRSVETMCGAQGKYWEPKDGSSR